ncbi:olfactory receptor 4C6-like [Hyla sarda]|uniref:olfactory receptor 4C6-like n=1 Tax=Hyla sarda TaxID=327740 RepID=UPI0024C2B642|nr:olfactory receptor 4C6-like [Hyla sarda]XP_056416253.1 olfactory receptor 4C6-like [Hyla sarda]
MENTFNVSKNLVLLGLVEMEGQKYLYCVLSIVLYSFIVLLSVVIVFVIFVDQRLHEPMYILISKLVLNGIFGSSVLFPKLIVDLISSSTTITHGNCAAQALCVGLFAFYEMSTFTIMAYDRYLAVCFPLHYGMLVTNERIINVIIGSLLVDSILVLIGLVLTWILPLCGNKINNIICDNMSMVILSCGDSSLSQLFAASFVTIYLCVTILVTIFSNLQIFVVCLKVSGESRQKAVHTLVTHLLNFSVFLIGLLFVFIRYRLSSVRLLTIGHILLSVTSLIVPPLFNPLIYGFRTHALKMRVTHNLQKMPAWPKMTKIHGPSISKLVISHNQS